MNQNPSLDLIVPCYNPVPQWTEKVLDSFAKIEKLLHDTSITLFIVNDGSKSGIDSNMVAAIKSSVPSFQWIEYSENKGKGAAIRKGVGVSKSPLVIYTDVDFPYKEEDLASIYHLLKGGASDVVVGVRDSDYYQKVPIFRTLISKFLKSMIKLLFRIPITDTQAGLKGFNDAGRKAFLDTRTNRYLFDLEFIHLASRRGLAIDTFNVTLKDNVVFSRMNPWILLREGGNLIKILIRR